MAVNSNSRERLAGDASPSPFWAEHRSRYRFAGRFVEGKSVVDVACGAGWGGAMLRDAGATSVLGIDASTEAIEMARKQEAPGYRVELGDATRLPVADGSVDIVVSFETLEHLDRPREFLAEARRVLADGGLLVLSTPNAEHTKPRDGVPRNPHHVREYTARELAAMLAERFGGVELLGQRVHPRFRPCPYWERAELRSGSLGMRARSLRWKLLARLPRRVREPLAGGLTGHALFPGEDGFAFDPSDVEGGHVLVAVCRT